MTTTKKSGELAEEVRQGVRLGPLAALVKHKDGCPETPLRQETFRNGAFRVSRCTDCSRQVVQDPDGSVRHA